MLQSQRCQNGKGACHTQILNIAVSGKLSWFFIALASEMVAASLTLLPVFFNKKRGLAALAGFTVSLIALLAVCCIYTGGNWFFMVLVSVVFGMSVIFMPLVLRDIWLPAPFGRNKTLIYFAANTLLLFALLLIAGIYVKGGWFTAAALPISTFCLALPWGCMLIIRYAKINRFFKAAGSLGLTCAWWLFMRGFLGKTLGEPYKFGLDFNFGELGNMEYLNSNIDAIIFFTLFGLMIVFTVSGIAREITKQKRGEAKI